MSKRLQIIVDDEEFEAIHAAAREEGRTMSDWARDVLRRARRERTGGDVARKLAVIRVAAEHEHPTADIDDMLAEIDRGRDAT